MLMQDERAVPSPSLLLNALCVRLLSMQIDFIGHLLSGSQFRLGPLKALLKSFTTASILHPFLLCNPTAEVSLTHVKGEKSLFQQERLKKEELYSLKFCNER